MRRRRFVHDAGRIVRAYDAPDRQHDGKSGSPTEDALGKNVPTERINELAGDAESQTCAAELTGPRLIHLAEVFPDGVEIAGANPDAGVAHVESQVLLVFGDRDPDPTLVRE